MSVRPTFDLPWWINSPVVDLTCPICDRNTTLDEISTGLATVSGINGDSRFGYEAMHSICGEVVDLREQVKTLNDLCKELMTARVGQLLRERAVRESFT